MTRVPSNLESLGGSGAVLEVELERARRAAAAERTVLLVEGASDRRAIAALARVRRRDLEVEGVVIVAIAGATNVTRFVTLLGPAGHDVRLAGLCDEAEEALFGDALAAAGVATGTTRPELAQVGFFVCVRDLEDELVRALGADAMERLIASQGDLRAFRSFQSQPAHRDEQLELQIWSWLGNHKIRYAPLMVDALDVDGVPAPLAAVLHHV